MGDRGDNPLQLSFDDWQPEDEDSRGKGAGDGPPPGLPDALPPVPPGKLLSEAQQEVRDGRWTKTGVRCGCCGRRNKVDPRTITRDIVWALVHVYRDCRTRPFYKPSVLRGVGTGSRYETIMKHYGVLVQCARPDGQSGRKDAWWRLTEKGAAWIEGRIRLPRKILLFHDDQFMGYEDENDTISIEDALGEPFSLSNFLASTPKRPAS